MPTAYIKKLATKDKSIKGKALDTKELERRWNKAKKIAAEEGHSEEWDYITGIFKKMVGESYSLEIKYTL